MNEKRVFLTKHSPAYWRVTLNHRPLNVFYDPRQPARYPHNGRTLTDDVVDVFFSMYTNRNVIDKVGPHRDLLEEFPNLASRTISDWMR